MRRGSPGLGRGPLVLGVAGLAAGVVVLAGQGPAPADQAGRADDDRPLVVTSSPLVADLVREVAGDRARVRSIVPMLEDPSQYEPTLRDLGEVARADLAFTNYPLQDGPAVTRTLAARLPADAETVVLAEESIRYSADIIAKVVDSSLDAPWLGLAVEGGTGATGGGGYPVAAISHDGPGDVVAYLTGTFGSVEVFLDSRDGFDAADGYRDDTLVLPPDAHTHMTWAFTRPGVHRLTLRAQAQPDPRRAARPVATATLTFAVGVDASSAGIDDADVVTSGHADIAVDPAGGRLLLRRDTPGAARSSDGHRHGADSGTPLERAVVVVPNRARTEVPDSPGYRFLGAPGATVLQLPQAVLGAHVSGEIDPHLWQDVGNARAYVELIRDRLTRRDPDGAATYAAGAERYLARLDRLEDDVAAIVGRVPAARRHLVTDHDRYAYLARGLGFDLAAVLSGQEGTEPGLQDRRRVGETLRNLRLPAVFAEPSALPGAAPLERVAERAGARVCTLHDDTFTPDVTTYVQLVLANARSVLDCLG